MNNLHATDGNSYQSGLMEVRNDDRSLLHLVALFFFFLFFGEGALL